MSLSQVQSPSATSSRRRRHPHRFRVADDPVGSGVVAVWRDRAATSPACRVLSTDLAGKRLELLREVVPGLRRLAIMANAGNPQAVLEVDEVKAAARTLGLEIVALEIRRAEDIAPAFEGLKADALYVVGDPLVPPTVLASSPLRSARDCRQSSITAFLLKRAV